jgi:hypothetical protein
MAGHIKKASVKRMVFAPSLPAMLPLFIPLPGRYVFYMMLRREANEMFSRGGGQTRGNIFAADDAPEKPSRSSLGPAPEIPPRPLLPSLKSTTPSAFGVHPSTEGNFRSQGQSQQQRHLCF